LVAVAVAVAVLTAPAARLHLVVVPVVTLAQQELADRQTLAAVAAAVDSWLLALALVVAVL
jgi:hypothetical protein